MIKYYKHEFYCKRNMAKNGIEVITFNEKNWLNEKHIEVQLQHSNLQHITNQYYQYSSELKKTKTRITKL